MKIALNIADLTRYDKIVVECMIAPHIQSKEMIKGEPKMADGMGVVLECPTDQALSIVEFLRTVADKKAKQYECRAYAQGPKGGWSKI